MVRIACCLIQNPAIQLALREHPDWRGQPLIVGGLPFEAAPVYDASPEAGAHGVRVGIPLRQAHALCPEARFLPVAEEVYQQTFGDVINILEDFSPTIDIEGLGRTYLDITGIAAEPGFAREIASAVYEGTGLAACLGISNSKLVSRAAALTSRPEAPVVVPSGKEKGFVAALSTSLIPVSDEIKQRLDRLGIRFIGEISRFSRVTLIEEFGSEGAVLYESAQGIDPIPLISWKKPEVLCPQVDLYPPATASEEILSPCRVALDRLQAYIKASGKACREIDVSIIYSSGGAQGRKFPIKEPSSDTLVLNRIKDWIENMGLPSPVSPIKLSLLLAREQGKRLSLFGQEKARKHLARVTHDLKTRFGYHPIKRVQEDPAAIVPEQQFKLLEIE